MDSIWKVEKESDLSSTFKTDIQEEIDKKELFIYSRKITTRYLLERTFILILSSACIAKFTVTFETYCWNMSPSTLNRWHFGPRANIQGRGKNGTIGSALVQQQKILGAEGKWLFSGFRLHFKFFSVFMSKTQHLVFMHAQLFSCLSSVTCIPITKNLKDFWRLACASLRSQCAL